MKDLAPQGIPTATMAVLMAAVFTVSMGFGVLLPLLPFIIERLLGAGAEVGEISQSTGLLTGLYMLSLFLFASMWGRLSDRYGRRAILLIGLVGFGATMLVFAFIESLVAVYAERVLSGLFAAAVTPVALATIGDLAATEEARARRLTFVSLSGISGFLLGPMLGVFIASAAADLVSSSDPMGSLAFPLGATAVLAFAVAGAAVFVLPRTRHRVQVSRPDLAVAVTSRWLIPKLLILAFIVAAGVGAFEVGLSLRGKQELGMSTTQIALMFTECSVVMIVVQAMVFSPWVRPSTTRWMIAPALVVLTIGLLLLPRATNFSWMLAVIGAVAASAGILTPILVYWISSRAGRAQGLQLGRQTAAASLGAAVGSAAGGLLYDVAWLPGGSFLIMSTLTGIGVVLSLGLPRMLSPPCSGSTESAL